MESGNIAIEIDGEAICLSCDGDNSEEIKKDQHADEIEESEKNAADRDGDYAKEKGKLVHLTRDELTKELLSKIVYSEEEAYRLYCDYGHCVGFSVRKGKQYYFTGTKNIRTKDYYCSKEGLKDDEQLTEANYNRPETRTNCKAMVRFRVDSQGQWKVIQIVSEHNHELVRPEDRHLLRSVKSLSIPKSGVLNAMVNAEIQAMHESLNMADDGATTFLMGSNERNCTAEVDFHGELVISAEDSKSLVSLFRRRMVEESMFHWDVSVDQEGRMRNIFFRDGRSRVDYECFGDVLVVDTTSRNKYGLVSVAFIGLNHHRQNVLFGCGFLSCESGASYEWMFRAFLDSMDGCVPRTIFSDQNEATTKAIERVFPSSCHFFSPLSIQKNLRAYLGKLNASETFYDMFTKCMQGCESEAEFEDTWGLMLHEYDLHDHQWLMDLYNVRQKWCFALQNDAFDGGIRIFGQGESLQNMFSGTAGEPSLTNFVLEFQKLVESWRRNESEEDFRCSHGAAECSVKNLNILRHAADVYTHKIYNLFETLFLSDCSSTSYQEIPCGGTFVRFEFMTHGSGPKGWIVLFDTSTLELNCSCKRFETVGLLCQHAINALSLKNVDRIPHRYLLSRWTRDARRRFFMFKQEDLLQQEQSDPCLAFRNRAMLFVHNLVMKSRDQKDLRKIVVDALVGGERALDSVLDSKRLHFHYSVREKDGNRGEKRKKKLSKLDKRKQKQAPTITGPDTVFVTPSSENLFFPAEEMPNNPSIGRAFYYQAAFPSADPSSSQIQGHANLHGMPHCSSQDFSAYSAMLPASSNFGSGRNF